MFRKRKNPTPHFRMPPPYQPVTGEEAPLRDFGDFPHCAMMQVATTDSEPDYVVCRGYDTRIKRYIDYPPGVPVAKPYGARTAYRYTIGQIFPAFLPLWEIGQNPGTVEAGGYEPGGHPSDLDADIEHLKDSDDKYVNWMLVDPSAATGLVELCLAEDHPGRDTAFSAYYGVWDPTANGGVGDWDYDSCSISVTAIDFRYDVPYPDAGATGLFTPRPSDLYGTIYECVSLDCSSPGPCCS